MQSAAKFAVGLVEALGDSLIQLLHTNGNPCSHQDLPGISYLHHGLLALNRTEPLKFAYQTPDGRLGGFVNNRRISRGAEHGDKLSS